jgi:hypothetical protein
MTTHFKRCGGGSRQPSNTELTALLERTLSYQTDTYIFLDALDESQEQIELVELVELVTSLQAGPKNTHLLLTSRRHAVFFDTIESDSFVEMVMDRNTIDMDIERYVQQQFANDLTLRRFSPALQTKTEAKLSDANGM